MAVSTTQLKRKAHELGFDIVGVTPAEPASTLDAYFRWIENGLHADMGYLARPDRQERRKDLNIIVPNVRSIVLVGLNRYNNSVPKDVLEDPSRGRIASYAWGDDYHEIVQKRLEILADWLGEEAGYDINHKAYIDTGPVLERAHAQQAGMGFVGKSAILINPKWGSHFSIGEILTDLEFTTYDEPIKNTSCGYCTRCLISCPTDAFVEPYVLNAKRCIAYQTLENKGWIDRELRPLMGNRILGCDVCQDVCPWQKYASPTKEEALYPVNYDRAAPPLLDLLAIDDAKFAEIFKGSGVFRVKRERIVRNACVAAGNWGSADAIPQLTMLLDDPSPLIRGHAAWALGQIMGDDARKLLTTHLDREQDEDVRNELELILN
jgi:epoxyqueuosine reductase